jgi:hypothetical protein
MARDFLHRHFVRRWHGKKQEIRVVRNGKQGPAVLEDNDAIGTRYDAGRWLRTARHFIVKSTPASLANCTACTSNGE